MFMILLLHANYVTFGLPAISSNSNHFILPIARILLEQLCVVAVNVYVLISGWFGIRASIKGFVNLLLPVFFYTVLLYIPFLLTSYETITIKDFILDVVVVGRPYWFVVSYLLLYILSPILNMYADRTNKNTYRVFLIIFFIFDFLYGWGNGKEQFACGYSCISFVGIYLLARYLKLYPCKISRVKGLFCLCLYVLTSLLTTIWIVVYSQIKDKCVLGDYICYNCPFVMFASLFLFFYFQKMNFKSSKINWLSASAFSVYLIHCHPIVFDFFCNSTKWLFDRFDGLLGIVVLFLWLCSVFFLCIFIDKLMKCFFLDTAINRIVGCVRKIYYFFIN